MIFLYPVPKGAKTASGIILPKNSTTLHSRFWYLVLFLTEMNQCCQDGS